MLVVLAAIEAIPDATVLRIAERTGLDRKTVSDLIEQAVSQAGVGIEKTGSQYRIKDWGPVIRAEGARAAAAGMLGDKGSV